jgi:hypothetical protein
MLFECSMPAFDSLLPNPHNEIILDLLFTLSTWHSLGKLRVHTEQTLGLLDTITTLLGQILRTFKKKICRAYKTMELRCEAASRDKRTAGKGKSAAKEKDLNLCTYKVHCLGDYVNAIQQFGTTDNYSSQVVCPGFILQT